MIPDETTVVDPIRLEHEIVAGNTDRHMVRAERDEKRKAQQAMINNFIRDEWYRTPDHWEPFLPAVQPQVFTPLPTDGSRRHDGLSHRSDEWTNHRGRDSRLGHTNVGAMPAHQKVTTMPTKLKSEIEIEQYQTLPKRPLSEHH